MVLNMYALFRDDPIGSKGFTLDPKRPYIQRQVKQQIQDVTNYYRRFPKIVDSRNLIAMILNHFVLEFRSDDAAWAKKVEDQSRGLVRTLGLCDAINKGKVFENGATLGPQCEEVVMSSIERFPTDRLKTCWRELKPLRYLYHSRSDINLPIMNNKTPGRGYGVLVINIPMLLVQYRHWVFSNFGTDEPAAINLYKFIGSYALVNCLESYLEIAYFNRLSRMAYGLPNTKYPLPHPFYIPDLTPVTDSIAKNTLSQRTMRTGMITELAQMTPMLLADSLYNVLQLPKGPVTMQNEWALALARVPYIKYLVDSLKKAPSMDKTQTNEILNELRESLHSQALRQNGNSPIMQQLVKDVEKLIKELA